MDAMLKALKPIAAIVFLAALLCVAAFVGAKFASATATPTVVTSLGPTVQQLEGMGQLTAVRVHITDVLTANGEGYRGSWLIKGDALLACDMANVEVVDRDDQKRKATIRMGLPTVISPRVDHEKTKTWSVEKSTWIPWKWGSQDRFRDSAMFHAQKLVEHAASSQDNIVQAKSQAELLIRKSYDLVDWHVVVVWKD